MLFKSQCHSQCPCLYDTALWNSYQTTAINTLKSCLCNHLPTLCACVMQSANKSWQLLLVVCRRLYQVTDWNSSLPIGLSNCLSLFTYPVTFDKQPTHIVSCRKQHRDSPPPQTEQRNCFMTRIQSLRSSSVSADNRYVSCDGDMRLLASPTQVNVRFHSQTLYTVTVAT